MITFEPSVINHRIAIHCGADVINGDNRNPVIVKGTQYTGYRFEAV